MALTIKGHGAAGEDAGFTLKVRVVRCLSGKEGKVQPGFWPEPLGGWWS